MINPKAYIERFTLFQQWLAATILSILPLLAAVSYAAFSLHQQNTDQAQLLKRVDLVRIGSSAVSDNVKELVRLSRQYALLLEPSFLTLYHQKNEALQDNVESLRSVLADSENRRLMDVLMKTATAAGQDLQKNVPINQADLSSSLQLLVSLNEGLSAAAESYRQKALVQRESEFNQIVNQLLLLTILALPGTILLVIMGTYMVSRPLWRLTEAIRVLVRQNWNVPVDIRGPKDVVMLGENLEWMRKQIIASERQTTAFIQHVTHELKTPIAAIIEAGNLLHEEIAGPLTAGQETIISVLRLNASNLEHLIQQLLNYNAVSHGIVTQWKEVDVVGLCNTIRSRIDASDAEKNVHWSFQGHPEKIWSDERLLEMILKNLLENSFQFVNKNGRIAVQWGIRDHESWISVSDDGPGIDPDDLPNIYKPFFTGMKARKRRSPKTGIGLSIVAECVHLLKGRIEAVSPPGKGVTFTISIPETVK